MTILVTARKACGTKRRYANRKAARAARRRTPSSDHLSIYYCPWCGWYHIGHLPKAVSQGKASRDAWLTKTGAR